jgi:hypothetical protein
MRFLIRAYFAALVATALFWISPNCNIRSHAAEQRGAVPCPNKAATEEATKRILDRFAADFAKASTPAKKVTLARELVRAAETEKEDAVRFMLLRLARDLAMDARDQESVIEAIRGILKHFLPDGKNSPREQLDYAESLRKQSKNLTGQRQRRLQADAAEWYLRAQPNVDGIDGLLVEKRLQEFGLFKTAPIVAPGVEASLAGTKDGSKMGHQELKSTKRSEAEGTVVCQSLIAKTKPEGLAAEAVAFDAPPGDGRRGANGFLIPAPETWATKGTAWRCSYRRDGTANGIHFIHPFQQGQVVVTLLTGVVHVDSPGKWQPGHLGYIPRTPGISLEKSANFERVLNMSGKNWHDISSALLANGQILIHIDQKLVVTGRVAAAVPLELGEGFQGPKLPRCLRPGEGGVIVGPRDSPGFNEALSIRNAEGEK